MPGRAPCCPSASTRLSCTQFQLVSHTDRSQRAFHRQGISGIFHGCRFLSEHPVALRCLSYLISCYSDKHVCFTFGFSFLFQGFGRAKHSVTTEKLKAKYPDYEITWADEGY